MAIPPRRPFPSPIAPAVVWATCAALCALGVLGAPGVASAEVPSVDAYGGQALVLGAPHHRHPGGGSGSQTQSGGRQASGRPTGASASGSTGIGPSAKGPSGGDSAGSGGSAGAGHKPGPGTKAAPGTASPNGDRSANGGPGRTSGANGETSQPANAKQPASSSAFGASDILLLIAGAISLAALGLWLRTSRRAA